MLTEITEAAKLGWAAKVGDFIHSYTYWLKLHWDEPWRKTFWKQ